MAIDKSKFRLKSTIKYPTSLLVNGASNLGLEIAESLLEQGGYVIIVDAYTPSNVQRITEKLGENSLISLLDYSSLLHLEEDLRRLDYIFYLAHDGSGTTDEKISTQAFLKYSNYLDATLGLAVKFEAKFLLTTSIKAHQHLMASMDLDINYGAQAVAKHTVYTDVEVQRYAESLTLEYVKKADLNARILRLGELIGNGIDFSVTSSFLELLTSAVAGRNLELRNDGLDSDWYVHILDCAYGIIKAQFTKSTRGEIYSLAYENSFTHLSIAYKLQELEPEASEIIFSDGNDGLPPLKLYKPAPNLDKVGWKPRISFDQAVKESLAEAKLYILSIPPEEAGDLEDVEDTLVGKIRSFINIARDNKEVESEAGDSGPVSRLIAERKRQEKIRQAALDKADSNIKVKKMSREKTRWDKIKGWIWKTFLDSRTNFPILRNLTPLQFLLYLMLIILGLGFYFGVFSPVIIVARNAYRVDQTMDTLGSDIQELKLYEAVEKLDYIEGSLNEIQEIIDRYSGVAETLALERYVSATQDSLLITSDALDALRDILFSAEPLTDYLANYSDNVSFRPNSDSYLSVGTSTDYSSILTTLEERSAYAKSGKENLEKSVIELQKQDMSFLPAFIEMPLTKVNQQLQGLAEMSSLADIPIYLPELLGDKTLLFVLLDNSRPMPIGGELSSYLLLSIQNGSISEARLQSIDAFTPSLENLPDYVIDEINLNSFEAKTAENLEMRDLSLISDVATFNEVVSELWATSLGRSVDATIMLNYSLVSDLLGLTGGIEVEGTQVNSENILQALSDLQAASQTAVRRNDIASQVFAKSFEKILSNLGEYFLEAANIISNNAQKYNVVVPSNNLKLSRAVADAGLNEGLITSADIVTRIGMISDQQVVSPSRFPAVNQITKITVNDDSSLEYEMTIKFPAVDNVDELSLCLPLSAKDISVEGVAPQRIKTNKSTDTICKVANIVAETEISYSWKTIQFESGSVSEYNLALGQAKIPGAEVVSDLEITLAPSLTLVSITPEVADFSDRVVFTENLKHDQIIDLLITKK